MVERSDEQDPRWAAVDAWVAEGSFDLAFIDADSPDPRVQGTRALSEAVSNEPRLTATAVRTVGAKKLDGFLLAVVGE